MKQKTSGTTHLLRLRWNWEGQKKALVISRYTYLHATFVCNSPAEVKRWFRGWKSNVISSYTHALWDRTLMCNSPTEVKWRLGRWKKKHLSLIPVVHACANRTERGCNLLAKVKRESGGLNCQLQTGLWDKLFVCYPPPEVERELRGPEEKHWSFPVTHYLQLTSLSQKVIQSVEKHQSFQLHTCVTR